MITHRANGYIKAFIVFFLLASEFPGCSQDPASVGINIIPAGEKYGAHSMTIAAYNDTSFKVAAANGAGSYVLLGSSAGTDVKALLRFDGIFPVALDSVHIDTAKLILTVGYTWNLGSAPAQFEINEVTTPWTSASVTADSLNSLVFVPTNSATFSNADTIGTGREMIATLDTSLVRRWINNSLDTSRSQFFSIAVSATSGSPNAGVWGFTEFGTATPPVLRIIYTVNGVKDSADVNTGDDTFLATRTSPPQPGFIEIQGGVSVRSRVSFNLKAISDSVKKAIVNNATVEMTLNNSLSILGAGAPDSILAFVAAVAEPPDSVAILYYAYGYRKDATQTTNSVYTFSVSLMAQDWINRPSSNFGLVLHSATDITSLDKLVFYSSKDSTKGPRLSVTYTIKN